MSTDLSFTRDFGATPDKIWRCWTEPELLRQWFAPKPVETIEAEIDPRAGGFFRTVMRIPGHGDQAGEGCILLADPARRLVWTNALLADFVPAPPDDGPMSFLFTVDIRLSGQNGGCRYDVRVSHRNAEDRKIHEDMGFQDGWGAAATQLETLARSLD